MRNRIVLSVVSATIITVLTACGGRLTTATKTGGGSSTAAPSSTSMGSPRPASSHASPLVPSSSHPEQEGTTSSPATKPVSHRSAASSVRFGPVASQDSTYTISIDPDGTTFTIVFSNIQAGVGDVALDPSYRPTFALTLPLTDGAHNSTVTFYASGYAFVTKGATARLIFSVNGHTAVKNFSAGWDDEYIQQLKLPAIPASECQLSLDLEVNQVPGSPDGTAQIGVSSIDGNIK